MGNSVSLEQVQRDAHAACPRSSMPASLQQARDAGVPRQITVCLMPSAPETGSEVSAAGFPIQGGNTSTVHADTTCSPNESSQKVLLWNCNPTDSHLKDQQYAAAVLNTNGSSSNQTSANLNKLLVSSRDHKHAMGPNFDMHPAVSSDVAASLPQSSSSSDSSDSSFQGRSYSNEETMPHGPEHSSDDGEDDDTPPALISPTLPVGNLGGVVNADRRHGDTNAAHQAGRLVIHPKSNTAAEQVVWVLQRQQLLAAPQQAAVDTNQNTEHLSSPAFILPCAKSPTQHVTTEWCLALQTPQHQQAALSSGCCTCQLALGLRWAPLGAVGASNSSSPADCQAPGSAATTPAASSSGGAEVHCRGKVSLHMDSTQTPITHTDFDIVLQQSGQTQELPIVFKVAGNSQGINAPSSIGQRQQQQQSPTSAALPGSFEEVRVVVDFTSVRLLQLVQQATAAVPAGSTPWQQQQQQQQDISANGRDQDQAQDSSNSSAIARELGSTAAAASARQLEAVLLSTSPRMLVVDGFFDAQLCNDLMELAEGKLVRSRVASGSETPSRTSWSHFFVKDAARQVLIMSAESQIEALFKSNAVRGPFPPLAKVEALQIVKYHEGEFYHEHYDNRADSPLTRAATIIVYLSDTEEGGATSFPRAVTGWSESSDWQLPPKVTFGPGGQGIKVFPVQGRALIFWSKRSDGSEDPNSIHAADTVVKGQKWIATRWMKDD